MHARVEDVPQESHPECSMSILSEVAPVPNEHSSDTESRVPAILAMTLRQSCLQMPTSSWSSLLKTGF